MDIGVSGGGRNDKLIGALIVFLLSFSSTFGQSDPPYVAVVRSPVATTTNPTTIEVHTGDSQTANVTFDKAVLEQGRYMFTLNSPRVPDEAMTNINSEPATLTLPTTMETAARTGIYTITVTEDESPAVAWRVLVTNEAAITKALEYSTGASMGDNVTVMVESSIDTARLRWRRDGVNNPDGSTGSSCVRKTSCGDASASNSVVFESHETGAYSEQVHAIMNVIVRECPENMWSPPDCTNICEPCINGGVCSDLTGLCLCPPGFSGKNCENIHGRNVFGQNAEYKCDDSGDDHADGCQGAIICYPDPLGCFCPAGYKGLNCTEECETGKFGANCKQECHCADNSLCALDTGVCENNQCEDGWRGTNCQYESNPQYVAVVRSPVATTTNPTTIEVYTGGSQTANVTFDKAVLQGAADSQRYMFTLNSPRVPDEAMTNISSEPATLTLPTNMETAARTGIYTITVTEDESPAVAWRVLVTNEAATIKALEYSTCASMGDNVTVMVESSVDTARLRWRKDGVLHPDGSTGSSCTGKTSCGDTSALKSVVFESQEQGEYSEQVHAIMNVIVRECPENMWSPPDCTNTCEPCINGGVCSDLTGLCLCPPGFSGNNCENIHGRNVFGQNAEYKCDDSGDDHADGCQGAIICYPDPLGCFCPAGYKGLNCTEECERGKFGANCKHECHCADNTLCALDTGVCENNQCEDGWRGTNCQYESNPQYVAVVRSPVATTTNPTTIEVYTGGSQTANVTFDKAVRLPDGADSPGYMFTLNSPRVPDEALENISSCEPATLTLPTTMETAARTGIYTITVTDVGSPAVAWRVLVTNEAATIKALEYSTGASMGDSVTVMVESSVDTARLRWRRDGVLHPDGSTGSSCVGKTSCGDVSALKSVVFESQESGQYNNQVHAIMNVIVRECPENMWSPPDCTNTCEPCINGGVCSDLTGLCLCPPGFSGNNCENIHGRNVFGQNAEYKCDDSGDDHADGCQGAIICYPDPLGCFCPAGYKGLNCTEECETGKFGANCKQECHCADNALCALDTGVCGNNQCEDGWRGTNCQYGPCPVGYYGDFCNLTCSCSGGEDACSEVEANCANGCAVPWTGIACNQDNGAGNIILTYVRVNSGQAAKVTCTVIRNPLVAQSDLVLSPIGTLLTADEDARSYNQTKVVEITLETAMQVTCSVSGTELMETISLMPNDTSASPVTDDATGITGSGATPVSAVSTNTPASPVTGDTAGSTVSGVTPVSSVSTDTSASPVTDGTTGATGSGATPASPVSGFTKRPAAFLAPTLTILAVVLLIVTIVIGIVVFRWYLRRKKSDPGATAAPSHDYARHIPLTTHGINVGDAEVGAYEVPKKTSFSALEKTGNVTYSDEDSNEVDAEYAISNEEMERESDSYNDVENGNKPGIKGSEMDCEGMDIGKATLDKCDLGNSIIRDRGPLPIIDISQTGRSLDVDECYQELPGTEESKDVVACRFKIKDLPKQLQDKNSVPEDTITDEFKKLLHGQQHPWTVGILKDDNRDSGILPYDHSRVKLHKDSSGSDIGYINANYIKVQHPQTFIASQDPNERTAELFWKMVWFEKVEVIVNLSQTKMSSFQYWPISEGTNKIIGDYTLIWYKSSLEDLDLSIREIKIVKGDKLHEVKLCHFLSWPDDRIPSQSVLFIDFIKKVKDLKTTRSQPLLVHCNNGVGANGTFIALYCLMDDLKDSKKTGLSVSSFVNRMRKDRVNMIENEVQYWFLYDCLVIDLLSPENTVEEDEIDLEKQKDEFKILETCRGFSVPHSSIVGRQSHNAKKNRYSAVLPYNFSRAVLQTPGSLIGNTDYINATVINSCCSKDAFIMTQSPLPSTAEDFWRMVHDYDCAAIVCLNQMDINDETTCLYWPDSGKIQHGNTIVECTNVEDKDKYCSQRRLIVYSKNTKRTVTVEHYQLIEWSPDSDQTGIIELIGKIKPITEEKRTIVVHCMDGASRCGVFVSILLEISRIKRSKTGRFFETVLKLTGQNPHVMKSLDDYLLCHQLVKAALVEDESKYQEVK
ncbi:uncharacterized protein [Apostichopus japonicus]|uniref:uncharacterized protein isoform X3 n=1 Tax=Stichopus japonicus TaxID=307972 RepID=UPI003AB8F7A7